MISNNVEGMYSVKFKVIIILLILNVFTCNLVWGQIGNSGFPKKFTHNGFHFGAYNSGLGWEGYNWWFDDVLLQ